ncbi:MAG TPA: methyltransferase domain-containing protein [Candidatus Eisenbacteria bacterium]|jgi:ubiquinone/menaquinone biosynthesis C-methylase UbiE
MTSPEKVAHAQFTASIPANYDRYLGPVIFDPYARDLAQRIRRSAPGRILETACGSGIATRRLLETLQPDAGLIATDLNPAMLDQARIAIGDDPRVSWEVADMCNLNFESASFDAVVCQFGIMFAPDKAAALREAHRVLRLGGQFLFNVWDTIDKNRFASIAHETITRLFPADPPTFYETPFGFHDRQLIRTMLESAGFSHINDVVVSTRSQSPSAEEFARGLVEGNPVVNEIQARGGASVDEVVKQLAASITKKLGGRPVPVHLQAIVFEAQSVDPTR